MRIKSKILSVLLLAVFLLGLGAVCLGSQPKIIPPYFVKLKSTGGPTKGAPITMQLEYSVNPHFFALADDTGSYSITFVDPRNYKDTLSRVTYPVTYDQTFSHSTTIELILPDADTSLCIVGLSCGSMQWNERRHFIVTGNEVQVLGFYYAMPPPLKYQKQQAKISYEVDRDTLSHEDLQREYTVVLDLHDPKDKEFVEKILGHLPDSSIFDKKLGYYLIKTTAKNVFKFIDQGIDGEEIRPQSRDPRLKRDQDSLPGDQFESDTSDQEGGQNPAPFTNTLTA